MREVSLIPYVCGAGASTPGAEQGPVYAWEHGLAEKLALLGIKCEWSVSPDTHWTGPYGRVAHESLPDRGTPERLEIVSWHIQTMARAVKMELERGRRVVAIGGDHSMAAGSVAGARAALGPQERLGLLWVDAHPDLHTFTSSQSKALHGMPVSALTGLGDVLLIPGVPHPVVRPENIIYAGLRDIDPGEVENAKALGINLLTMGALRAGGVDRLLQEAVMELSSRCDHIALSLDVDGFSQELAPATGTPVPGGFTADEILPVLAGIVRSHSVPLIDIVEFNPTLPGADQTFNFILEILDRLLPKA